MATNMWEQTEEMAKKHDADSSTWLKLANDEDKAVVVFLGEPYPREVSFVDGKYVPNLELAHHPLRKGKTYEETVDNATLEDIGKKRWRGRVSAVVAQVLPIWNPRVLYLGGGNARLLKPEAFPDNVKITENIAGLLGGIALWKTDLRRRPALAQLPAFQEWAIASPVFTLRALGPPPRRLRRCSHTRQGRSAQEHGADDGG